jgi:hypothetical protein
MPYDPDWDSEEDGRTTPNLPGAEVDYRRSPFEYDADGMRVVAGEEGEQKNDYGEEQENFEEAEEMEVDPPRPDRSQFPKKDPDATPRNNLPFPGAELARMPQVEVVLHSSPRRPAFIATLAESTGEVVDETNLVTSDIVPKPRDKQSEDLAAKAQVVPPPTTQPPVAPTPLPTATPQPKKRGRPVGWRLGHGSYAALRQGLPPGTETPRPQPKKPTGEHKPRVRPGRKPAPTARQLYLKLNPHFISFRCEWENCPAELQNLETLRKHLLIVHGRPPPSSKTITCKWAACPSAPFPSPSSFTTHLETAHLLPHLWHAGDGPRNTTPSLPNPTLTNTTNTSTTNNPLPLPAYLFNAQGDQVTPSITTQQLENDDDRKKRQARIQRVLLLRDHHAPEEPEYTEREKEIIGEVFAAKQARLRMLGAYAERVGKGGMEGWRVG